MQIAIDAYLTYLRYEVNASAQTISAYGDDLKHYYTYCFERLGEEVEPSSADLDLVRGWIAEQMGRGLKASSVGRRLAAVKGLYRYLLKTKRIERNPISALRPPRGERPLPVYVPTDELDSILSAPIDRSNWMAVRNQLIIATLYECGLRRSELAGLCTVDVNLTRRTLKVLGKGKKERIVPFGTGLAKMMKHWLRLRNKTFGNTVSFFVNLRGEAMDGAGIYRIVHKALATVPHLSRRGAHALRHSFATDMLNAGAELMAIKELMGHSQVATTAGYTHSSFEQLKQMYNAHPRAKKKKN